MDIRIINNTKHIKHVGEVSLNIGANMVKEELWAAVKNHPIVKDWVENGNVEAEQGNLDDITKITPGDKAVKVIETTFDMEKLEKWQQAEKRKLVSAAIIKQIEYLKNEKPQE